MTDISERPEAKGWLEQVEIRFCVDEVFSGIKGDFVEVYTGNGGGDCSIRVEQGRQYLIDAWKDKNGKLKAGICSLTRSVEDAAALLPQLRAMRDHGKPASLYGMIRQSYRGYHADFNDPYESRFMPNIVVRVRGSDKSFETVSDANGAYVSPMFPPTTIRWNLHYRRDGAPKVQNLNFPQAAVLNRTSISRPIRAYPEESLMRGTAALLTQASN